jgi:hypothetical protein
MIGCICVLDPKCIPSIAHTARQTAFFLGIDGIRFLGDILQVAAIAMAPESFSIYEWWQLPNAPTELVKHPELKTDRMRPLRSPSEYSNKIIRTM